MSDDLITLGTYHNVTEAQFAVNRLKEAGINAVVADANLVTWDYILGGAIGWIKVQVRAGDLERAEAVLADPAEPVAEEEIPWDEVDETATDEPPEEIEQRIAAQKAAPAETDTGMPRGERLTAAAYRLAIFGIAFVPLSLISLFVLVLVSFRYSDLSTAGNRKYFLAMLLNFVLITFWGMLLCSGIFWEPLLF
jgi:Putative prokaryotic signal transducing protein